MHKLIYKLFFLAGLIASAFGATDDAVAKTGFDGSPVTMTCAKTDNDNKLYFSDAMGNNGQSDVLFAGHYSHYSHSSHSSHYSHRSHYSHVSSRY